MANLININAEEGANMIGDDAEPTLNLENSSTGAGLEVDRLVVSSTATIAGAIDATGNLAVGGTLDVDGLTTLDGVNSDSGILSALATVAVSLSVAGSSVASGAAIAFTGDSLTSTASIVFAASANWAGLRTGRVVLEDGNFGHLVVFPDAVVTNAAI